MNTKMMVTRADEILKPLNFFHHNLTWNRRSRDFTDVINLQKSKAGDVLTINVGVLHLRAYMLYTGTRPPEMVQETECTVRARIGEFVENKDLWWSPIDIVRNNDFRERSSSKNRCFRMPWGKG